MEIPSINIDLGTFLLMLEVIGGSIFLNVYAIRSRLNLIRKGRQETKKYIFTCEEKK